jgi:hypothetical protein
MSQQQSHQALLEGVVTTPTVATSSSSSSPSKLPTKSSGSHNTVTTGTERPMTRSMKHPSNTQQLLKKSSRELSKSLSQDLPLLMYGSGDVYPYHTTNINTNTISSSNQNDPNTVSLLAELTCDFIYDLVHAAIDSHDIYTNGKCFGRNSGGGGGGIIYSYQSTISSGKDTGILNNNHNNHNNDNINNIRKRNRDWEEELPIPIITSLQKSEQEQQIPLPPPPLWQGSIGLNISSNEIRSKYMSSTQTINEKSFLLPIYHDEIMYNRCKEILSFHQDVTDVLFDPVVRQVVNEGIMDEKLMNDRVMGSDVNGGMSNKGMGSRNDVDRKRQKQGNVVNNNNLNDKDGFDVVNWPGFDSLLDVHVPTQK